MSKAFTSRSLAAIRFAIVLRRSANRPARVFPHMCVKPRNENVSGRPRPRRLLWGSLLACRPRAVFDHSRAQPFLDEPQDPLIRDAMLDEPPHPPVVDGVVEATDVSIEYPVH